MPLSTLDAGPQPPVGGGYPSYAPPPPATGTFGGGGSAFGYAPAYGGGVPSFSPFRRRINSFATLNQGGGGDSMSANGGRMAMPAGANAIEASAGGGPGNISIPDWLSSDAAPPLLSQSGIGAASQQPESWDSFLQRYMKGNDMERLLGQFGFPSGAFDPNSPALSEAQQRVIRDRGEAQRLGAMNRARLDSGGDPSLMAYSNIQSQFNTGNQLGRAMNEADLQRQQDLEQFYREAMMQRMLSALGLDVNRQIQPKQPRNPIGIQTPIGGINF